MLWGQTGAGQQVQLHHWEVGGEIEAAGRGLEAAQLCPAHVRDGGGGGQADGHRHSALHGHHISRAQILVGTSPEGFSRINWSIKLSGQLLEHTQERTAQTSNSYSRRYKFQS